MNFKVIAAFTTYFVIMVLKISNFLCSSVNQILKRKKNETEFLTVLELNNSI